MEVPAPVIQATVHVPAEIDYARTKKSRRREGDRSSDPNVSNSERTVSVAAGAILAGLGLARRDVVGALAGVVGGALVYRGMTGHCHLYQALGIDTCQTDVTREMEEEDE